MHGQNGVKRGPSSLKVASKWCAYLWGSSGIFPQERSPTLPGRRSGPCRARHPGATPAGQAGSSTSQKPLTWKSVQACVPSDAFLQGGCICCCTSTSLAHPHQFCGNFKAARPPFDTPLIWRSLYSSGTQNAAQCWPTHSMSQLSPRAVLWLWRRTCHHQRSDVAAQYCSQALAGDDAGHLSRTASVRDGPPRPRVLQRRDERCVGFPGALEKECNMCDYFSYGTSRIM
jgi:hypothetical protein